jgi:hypothetical protein
VESWKGLYEKPNAPFSWRSESVEVLDSGKLAHSSGPVLNAKGERVGTFNSIWRRERDGSWKVVFDKGCDACRLHRAREVTSAASAASAERAAVVPHVKFRGRACDTRHCPTRLPGRHSSPR